MTVSVQSTLAKHTDTHTHHGIIIIVLLSPFPPINCDSISLVGAGDVSRYFSVCNVLCYLVSGAGHFPSGNNDEMYSRTRARTAMLMV